MGQQGSKLTKTLSGHVIIDDANDRLYVNDDNLNPIALLGKDSQGKIVVKVARDGQNVITAPDNELIFNSEQDVFKIVLSGTASGNLPSAGSINTITIPHNLGFTPIPMVFLSGGGHYSPLPAVPALGDGPSFTGIRVDQLMTVSVDNENLYIQQALSPQAASGYAVTYKYYLLQETAN